jgi:uncharacterized protein (TIGR02757 family)
MAHFARNRVASDLKQHLDSFLDGFSRERHLASDPVNFVHRYDDPRDREVAGLVASAFAYGNVKAVLPTVERALSFLGSRPAQALRSFDPRTGGRRLRGFYHRFNTSRDLAVFFWIMRRVLEDYGSIERAFVTGVSEGDVDTGKGLERFSTLLLGFGHEQFYPEGELERRIGVRFLFPSPADGSACKRMNLYLRWMVRAADGIDCGVWTSLRPKMLVIPLDTHIARISGYIGLTDRTSPGWPMALDVTRSLRRLDRNDPLKYDFALCHLGIAGDCPRKRDLEKCIACPIKYICRL